MILLVFNSKVFCYIIIERKNSTLVKILNTCISLVYLNKVMLYFHVKFSISIPQFAPLEASIYQTPQQPQYRLEIYFPHQRSILLSQETNL